MSPRGYAVGALAGIGFYLVREIIARLHNWRYRIWDGRLDVGLPLWIPGTLALAILFGHVPGWLVALFVALAALIFYSYTFGRPPGALLDDGSY
jgi:energy-converting hydrogenase Eha subunit G